MSTLSFQKISILLAIAGAAIVYLAIRLYARRARRDKHLRAEVREEREALRCMIDALPEQLEAKRSRMAGVSRSEATQQWLSQIEVDLAEAKLMGSQLPAVDTDDTDRSGMELDIKLAEILALSIRANRLADKYRLLLTAEHPAGLVANAESPFEQTASTV